MHRLSNIDELAREADCAICGRVRIQSRGRGTYRCTIARQKTRRSRHHGLTKSEREAIVQEKPVCEICGKKLTNASARIDHDHVNGKIRGVLCNGCNTGLGNFNDETWKLMSAVGYLMRHAN
jgi:hypothetical protein